MSLRICSHFLTRKTVFALSVLFHLSNIYVASGASCGCSSIVIPVHVDVLIPKDPADPFGGLKTGNCVSYTAIRVNCF
ncbi:hypothetical protein B0H14DRAFT_2906575 [Mycena olivaceomarginata]|nr:hypothetical protein B0H14DRAFT_2906575 [Mycena olivaceomarginata]